MSFFNYNGKFYKQGEPVITPDNLSLKYGDGLFETFKMVDSKLQLKEFHFERLFNGMRILAFDVSPDFIASFLEQEIVALAKKNKHHKVTRIRLTVLKGDESFGEPGYNFAQYIIQTWDIPGNTAFNSDGLIIDIYPHVKKSCDILANIKTNNFLPYRLATLHAKKHGLNDCIILNSQNNICDTGIANIFIIKDGLIYTPSLSEGCVAGVMRRWILQEIKLGGKGVIEKSLNAEDIEKADEIFLTNSLYPLRWVKQFKDFQYTNTRAACIYDDLIKTF